MKKDQHTPLLHDLKQRILAFRRTKKRQFPSDIKDLVCDLNRQGMAQKRLCLELNLASSVVSAWCSRSTPRNRKPPRVFQINHSQQSTSHQQQQDLRLSLGDFVINISLKGKSQT